MKRVIFAAMLVLSACASEQEQLAQQAIENACAEGNLQACIAIQQAEQERRLRVARALQGAGQSLQRTSQTTTCNTFGNQVTCNTF